MLLLIKANTVKNQIPTMMASCLSKKPPGICTMLIKVTAGYSWLIIDPKPKIP